MTLPFSAILPPEAPLPAGRSGLVVDVQRPYHQGRQTLRSDLFLDGVQVPLAPGRWLVAVVPGRHHLRMTTTYGRGLQATLTLAPGETRYAGPFPWDGTGLHLLPAPPPLPIPSPVTGTRPPPRWRLRCRR
jgi:hypothetical protein